MASINFVDYLTVIPASWLNDVNAMVYDGVFPSSSLTLTNLNVTTSLSGDGVTALFSSPPAIGNTTPNTGRFSSLTLATPLSTANGGLGTTTSPAAGYVPIGTGSGYNPAAITAGTGIQIVNEAGAITISAPYAGSGYSGLSGYSGFSGRSGYSGVNGVGTSGYSGYSGINGMGTSGYSGYSGAGVSGYSGYSGIGVAGASGFSGYSGTAGSGASITWRVNNYSGTGSQTGFTLSYSATSLNTTSVYVNGIYQQKNSYTVSGTSLSFGVAPPSTSSIEVVYY